MSDLLKVKFTPDSDLRVAKELLSTGDKHLVESGRNKEYACVLSRGAKVGGGLGGVATPPEFWKGGLNPLIFRKICVEIIKIRLFCVKFLKVGLF